VKALIKVGYGCNENCTFCHTLDVRHIDGAASEIHAKIDRAAELGHTMVVLSGGEPTIRPELVEWAAHTARVGLDFGLVTNGRMLAYAGLVETLLAHRLKYVYLSLHGPPRVHNALVRSDSFSESFAALQNLSGRGLDLTANCVVTRQNVDHLRALVDVCLPFRDLTLKFSMVQPKGGGAHAFAALVPRVSEVGARVVEAIDYGLQRSDGLRFAHDGIPLCHVPGHEQRYDDLRTHRFATMVEIGEPDFFPVDDRAKVQPAPCTKCTLRGPCPGLFAGYREQFGDGELRPREGAARPNSFNYVFEALVPDREGCPLLDGVGVRPWDRARHLFVKNGARVARFRATTRDFADVELDEIKHRLGQLYIDRSTKPAPDDFARDLVMLQRSKICAPCPERDACTGLYEPLFDDVFARDDARVRAIVSALDGDVLDLGCGDGPYDDLLGPLVAAGRVRYVGVDPRPRRPRFGELRVCEAESLDEPARYDHVLILRSWNHLRDPARALVAAVRAMRPGALLTLVDNVAFGLARSAPQAARAEASRAGFEHFRNDDAGRAHEIARAFPLELVERRDVGPATCNQWLLRYRLAR
jgi:hypothetical protein